ncbi:bifunctional diaminohydroxyphosphoribosylaminopyrimidine deaminase/5-amino-6-(5-phosphoribosylamino)uracil reductase RibD [Candidatus Magnetaquicoccus inordinatus]|uniref:bifunctional diaminohydroxyphosphoribosylaminopyrimidine deaminase/5-amino-6-(5-phosphoribosylamino)uracil reductase RibD n=1 Tax=Candidatus Magnetaquicoccus inordinatus TaxID=2496818 RepID=UPI00102C3991|nr:bifunctional diaminohydroxyphosphoribosylaminopyrimidine deaminase/5-amino-6-(5-phosphoribosylamino)uracil reductase RibD [Candidatus Magnetaquicoccus inordinatus]
MEEQDRHYMEQALRLARRALGQTRPNPLVGCLLVREGRVVGKGYHRQAGGPHAEVWALQQAAEQARGATAYVTLEPCSHFGRTPPCADALLRAGVVRVVAALEDPNPQVAGRGLQRLRDAGVAVQVGLCREQAEQLNRPFLSWIGRGRPWVTVKMAASLDGKTATMTGESQWITGPAARRRVQRMRAEQDAVLTGIGTVLADNPRLNSRLPGGRDPVRVVVDSGLRTPLQAAIVTSSAQAPLWIACCESVAKERRAVWQEWERLGRVAIIPCRATTEGRVDLLDLLQKLAQREIGSLLVEAGARLNGGLFAAGLVDSLALFLAPCLLGGEGAAGLLAGVGVAHLADAWRLTDWRMLPVGEDLLLEGRVVRQCLPD